MAKQEDLIVCDPTRNKGSTVIINGKEVPHNARGIHYDRETTDDVLKDHELVPTHTAGMAVAPKDKADGDGTNLGGGSGPAYTLPAATTAAIGGVKQGAKVADAAGDTPTKAEFNALLAQLRNAGVIAK